MKIKLVLALVLLAMTFLAASAGISSSSRVKACSGDDCGCGVAMQACMAGCSTQACRAQCRRDSIDCAIACCSY